MKEGLPFGLDGGTPLLGLRGLLGGGIDGCCDGFRKELGFCDGR